MNFWVTVALILIVGIGSSLFTYLTTRLRMERLSAAGYPVVPHLSARLVRDRGHLEEVLARLSEAGIRELFVPAGDATEPGEFQGAADLLEAMGDSRTQFDRIGITGYPESHHLISDEETIRAMFVKAEMATDIVSQLCFDPATIGWWIGAGAGCRGSRLLPTRANGRPAFAQYRPSGPNGALKWFS